MTVNVTEIMTVTVTLTLSSNPNPHPDPNQVVSVKLFNSAVIPKARLCQEREKVERQLTLALTLNLTNPHPEPH